MKFTKIYTNFRKVLGMNTAKNVSMHVDPTLYDQHDEVQSQSSQKWLESLRDGHKNRKFETIVDIGCGTGKTTKLIANFFDCKNVVAFDSSPTMVEYANKRHRVGNTVKYKVGDILDEWNVLNASIGLEDTVDAVFSIYCLHWVTDHKRALENIYSMLRSGGIAYLLVFFWSDVLPVQERLAHGQKWRKYFHSNDVVRSTTAEDSSAPFPVSCPDEEARIVKWKETCKQAGFLNHEVIHTSDWHKFANLEEYKGHVKSICHYFSYLPRERHEEFLEEFVDFVHKNYFKRQECYPALRLRNEYLKITLTKTSTS